jgi:hypothetical protein
VSGLASGTTRPTFANECSDVRNGAIQTEGGAVSIGIPRSRRPKPSLTLKDLCSRLK